MIAKSTNPLSPDVVILIDGVEVDYTSIVGFTMYLDENQHDMCVIDMRGIPPKAITDYLDRGVRVSLRNGPGRHQIFCGYVHYIETESVTRDGLINRSPFQNASIVCLGASSVMKDEKQKVWKDISIGLLAQHLAKTYEFSLDVKTDPYVYSRLVQKSESDWAFLVRVAELYGCRVSVHGTHMHVWDPFKAIGRLPSFTKLLTTRNNLDLAPGMILNFKGTFGLETPNGKSTDYKVVSLDSNGTLVSLSSSANPPETWTGYEKRTKYNRMVTGTPQNVDEARYTLEVLSRESRAFNATVEITAGAGIVPGGVVEVTEYNSNFDGLWYVNKVMHTMGATQYTTTLEISRDFNEDNRYNIPTVEVAQEPPSAIFENLKWKSSDSRVIRYV